MKAPQQFLGIECMELSQPFAAISSSNCDGIAGSNAEQVRQAKLDQLVRMFYSAVSGLHKNEMNADMKQLVRKAAKLGDCGMSAFTEAINQKLGEARSVYRLRLAMDSAPDGAINMGVMFIVKDGQLTGEALSIERI